MERVSGKRFSPSASAGAAQPQWQRQSGSRPVSPSLSNSISSSRVAGGAGTVQAMLNDLIEISHGIAQYLDQENAETQNASRQQTALKAQEIERIVRKVESHFAKKIAALESSNAQLQNEVLLLAKKIKSMQQQQQRAHVDPVVQREVVDAVPSRHTSSTHATSPRQRPGQQQPQQQQQQQQHGGATAEELRSLLAAEKRQRLMVEEQTYSLAEQHAKVVATLERRLQRQEEQLRELVGNLDRPTVPLSPHRLGGRAQESVPSTPALSSKATAPPPPAPTPPTAPAPPPAPATDVDEIGQFLDNISKELASIGS